MNINNIINRTFTLFFLISFVFTSCSQKIYKTGEKRAAKSDEISSSKPAGGEDDELKLIKEAEKEATEEGRAILETGRKMALEDKVIIKGSCWNWVNECFKRAGYSTDKHIAYKSKKSGPYVAQDKIQAGDWLYYVNYSYGMIEHSGIFVYWIDYKKKIGMILSYGGEGRGAPGRYLPYDLKDVYYITRAGKKK